MHLAYKRKKKFFGKVATYFSTCSFSSLHLTQRCSNFFNSFKKYVFSKFAKQVSLAVMTSSLDSISARRVTFPCLETKVARGQLWRIRWMGQELVVQFDKNPIRRGRVFTPTALLFANICKQCSQTILGWCKCTLT